MKFLVDAQLPVRLARWLQTAGYDVIHTRDLAQQNQTTDVQINALSIQERRIVITKDSDFFDSFLIRQEPYKLLQVTTGNITNTELETLFAQNLAQLIDVKLAGRNLPPGRLYLFQQHDVIEMSRDTIIVHQ